MFNSTITFAWIVIEKVQGCGGLLVEQKKFRKLNFDSSNVGHDSK